MTRSWALPTVRMWMRPVFRWTYRAMAAVTALVVVVGLGFFAADTFRSVPAQEAYGLFLGNGSRPCLVTDFFGQTAAKAGVRTGDRIVSVNGVPTGAGASCFSVSSMLAKTTGDAAQFTVQRGSDPVRTVTIPRLRAIWLETGIPYEIPNWLVYVMWFLGIAVPTVVLLGASVFLHERRPFDPEAMVLSLSFLSLCFTPEVRLWVSQLLNIPQPLGGLALLLGWALASIGIAGLPDGRFVSRWSRAALLAALASLAFFLAYPFTGTLAAVKGFGIIFLALSLGLGIPGLIVRYVRSEAGAGRQQIKWALLGGGMAAMVFLAWLALLAGQTLGGWHFAPWMNFVLNVLIRFALYAAIPVGILVAVLRYRLYDSDAAIAGSVAYAGLCVTLLGVFTASESLITGAGTQFVSAQFGSFGGAMAAAVTALAIAPLRDRFKRFSERSFRKDLFRLREQLPALVGDLRETVDLRRLADAALERIKLGVRAPRVVMLVDDRVFGDAEDDCSDLARWRAGWTPKPDKGLDSDRHDPVFPVRIPLSADGLGNIGWVLLSPRPDGSLYGKEERSALKHIADPLARALSVARDRAAHKLDIERRIGELETALAGLAGQLSRFQAKPAKAPKT